VREPASARTAREAKETREEYGSDVAAESVRCLVTSAFIDTGSDEHAGDACVALYFGVELPLRRAFARLDARLEAIERNTRRGQ
jgi:hypothetical protein